MADETRDWLLYVACRRGRPEQLLPLAELRRYVDNHMQYADAPWLEWKIVSSQKEALRALRPTLPRLALIEIDTDQQRLQFCAALRERAPSLKMVAVGIVKALPIDLVDAVDAALCSPVDAAQVANVLAQLLDGDKGGALHLGVLHLDLAACTVLTPKGQYHMTPKTTALLHYLMTHPGQVLSRRDLMQNVWDTTFLGDTRTLDVHIRWLRERIEDDPSEPKRLTTVRGSGYRLLV